MPTDPQLVLEINEKNEIIRKHRGRAAVIARLDTDPKTGKTTLYWKDEGCQASFHKSVQAFLGEEGIKLDLILWEGMAPDVIPPTAPPRPAMHAMQGDCTPAYLEWLVENAPCEFQVQMGVKVRALEKGEVAPKDPRKLWVRHDVIRTVTQPTVESRGGQYISTRFKMENQIIARRQSHITFSENEIFRGDEATAQADPFVDPYSEENLKRLQQHNKIEVVSVKNSAASAGSVY